MFSKVAGSLRNFIEFSPKSTWNSLSPLNKLILKLATAIFAIYTINYFLLKKLTAGSTESKETTTVSTDNKQQINSNKTHEHQNLAPLQLPIHQHLTTPEEPKEENSHNRQNDSSNNERSDDDISKNPKKNEEQNTIVTVLPITKKEEEKASLTDLQNTSTEKTDPPAIEQAMTKTAEAAESVFLNPKLIEPTLQTNQQTLTEPLESKVAPSQATLKKDVTLQVASEKEIVKESITNQPGFLDAFAQIGLTEDVIKSHVNELQKLNKLRLAINLTFSHAESHLKFKEFMMKETYSETEMDYLNRCTDFQKKQRHFKKLFDQYPLPTSVLFIKLIGEENAHENDIAMLVSNFEYWNDQTIYSCTDYAKDLTNRAYKAKLGNGSNPANSSFLIDVRADLEERVNLIASDPQKSFDTFPKELKDLIFDCLHFTTIFKHRFDKLYKAQQEIIFKGHIKTDIQRIFSIAELQTRINAKNAKKNLDTQPASIIDQSQGTPKQAPIKENVTVQSTATTPPAEKNADPLSDHIDELQKIRKLRLAINLKFNPYGANKDEFNKFMNKDNLSDDELHYLKQCDECEKRGDVISHSILQQLASETGEQAINTKKAELVKMQEENYDEEHIIGLIANFKYFDSQNNILKCVNGLKQLKKYAFNKRFGDITTQLNDPELFEITRNTLENHLVLIPNNTENDTRTVLQRTLIFECVRFKKMFQQRYEKLTPKERDNIFEAAIQDDIEAIFAIAELKNKLESKIGKMSPTPLTILKFFDLKEAPKDQALMEHNLQQAQQAELAAKTTTTVKEKFIVFMYIIKKLRKEINLNIFDPEQLRKFLDRKGLYTEQESEYFNYCQAVSKMKNLIWEMECSKKHIDTANTELQSKYMKNCEGIVSRIIELREYLKQTNGNDDVFDRISLSTLKSFGIDICREYYYSKIVGGTVTRKILISELQKVRDKRLEINVFLSDVDAATTLMDNLIKTPQQTAFIEMCKVFRKNRERILYDMISDVMDTGVKFEDAKEIVARIIGIKNYQEYEFILSVSSYYDWTYPIYESCVKDMELIKKSAGFGNEKLKPTAIKDIDLMVVLKITLVEQSKNKQLGETSKKLIAACREFSNIYFARYSRVPIEKENDYFTEDFKRDIKAIFDIAELDDSNAS
ncbi:MAG: hypothetical protein H0W88_06660 [Parachlamydiaceae bacterium]|nr:hypothetical protein [Parachlamydiaceae bacterium]